MSTVDLTSTVRGARAKRRGGTHNYNKKVAASVNKDLC